MKMLISAALLGTLCLPAAAIDYTFNVRYNGNGNSELYGLSDVPEGTLLEIGDSFNWTIKAAGSNVWNVVVGGDAFPLMAFTVAEDGSREGDFTLTLRSAGGDVLSLSEIGSVQGDVHIGTNTVTLPTGLVFDEMNLVYTFTGLTGTTTTLNSRLPIFGTPEMNTVAFDGTVIYGPVPEPQTWALLLAGIAGVGWSVRRRAQV